MDLSWLDPGDFVKVKTNDDTFVGVYVKSDDTFLIIKDNKGLKHMINVPKLESISQIDADELARGSQPAPVRNVYTPPVQGVYTAPVITAVPQPNVADLDTVYRSALTKINAAAVKEPWDFLKIKKYNGLKDQYPSQHKLFQSVCNSLEYAITKDKSSIDDKTAAAIQRMGYIFNESKKTEVMEIMAYLYTLYSPKKRFKKGAFCEGHYYLALNTDKSVAMNYYLSNALLPSALMLWDEYGKAPHVLVYVISKGFSRSPENDLQLIESVNEIYSDPLADVTTKNLVLYAITLALGIGTSFSSSPASDDTLTAKLKEAIEGAVSNYSGQGTVTSVKNGIGTIVDSQYRISTFNLSQTGIKEGDIVLFEYNGASKTSTVIKVVTPEDANYTNLKSFYNHASKSDNEEVAHICQKLFPVIFTSLSGENKPKASTDLSYSRIIKELQAAKTAEDCEEVSKIMHAYIDGNGPSKKNAIKDLIQLYTRKIYAQYERSIEVFEKHRHLFNSDNAEKLKIWRSVIPAYIAAKKFKEAIGLLDASLALQETIQDYVKLAFCYLQLEEYPKTLDICDRAIAGYKNMNHSDYNAFEAYRFAAFIGLRKYDEAERVLNEIAQVSTNTEKIENMRKILDDVVHGRISENQAEELADIIAFGESGNSDDQFVVSELYTDYLKFMLDECQYSQIRDRVYDEENKRYVWNPENVEKAEAAYKELLRRSSIFQDDRVRPGVFEEVADKRLNMAKVAEFCLTHAADMNISGEKSQVWKAQFIWASAEFLWLHYRSYDLKNNAMMDTSSFFLSECINMFFKDMNYRNRYEFYDAVNQLIIYQVKVLNPNHGYVFENITVKRSDKLNARKVGEAAVNAEIASMENIIVTNFTKVLKGEPELAVKLLGMLAANRNKTALTYLSTLFESLQDDIIRVFSEYFNDEYSNMPLAKLLEKYAEDIDDLYVNTALTLKQLSEALSNQSWLDVRTYTDTLKRLLESEAFDYLCATDKERCKELVNLLNTLVELRTDSTNYEISQNNITLIKTSVLHLKEDYSKNPTQLSFYYLLEILELIFKTVTYINNDIVEQSLPEIELEDEYAKEGYFPQNNRIDLMLLVSNGISGKQCTPASNITLDILPNESTNRYCNCTQTRFTLVSTLSGGKCKSQTIPLPLTPEGCISDTVFDLPIRITYQTIRSSIESVERVLNIRIKSEDEFIEIPNLYDKKMISPNTRMASLFKGRDNDIANISNILLSGGWGKTVLIYGQYRSGKSSLANFLVDSLKKRCPSAIEVNAGSVITDDNVWDIINKITGSICDNLSDYEALPDYLEEYLYSEATEDNYARYFSNFARKLKKYLDSFPEDNPRQIILMLDEVGRFFANHDSNNFMQLWKSVMEMEVFNAILIGHDIITQMVQQDTNSLGVINLYQINYIDKDSAVQLITEPTRMSDSRNRFTDNAIEYIWDQSA